MRIAAFTMARDESVFLDIWLKHYGQLGRGSLFVLDHGSVPPAAVPEGVTVVRLPRTPADEVTRARLVSDFNAFLLATFDVTVFSDADEIVVPDPARFPDLRAYIASRDDALVAGVGLALSHRRGREGEIDPARPILGQRGYAQFHGLYCKPLISRARTQWRHGFHGAHEPYEIDPDLYIFHLKAMDHRLAHRMLELRRQGPQSARMLEKQHSTQFRMDADTFDAAYFPLAEPDFAQAQDGFAFDDELRRKREEVEINHAPGSLRRIPERFRRAF